MSNTNTIAMPVTFRSLFVELVATIKERSQLPECKSALVLQSFVFTETEKFLAKLSTSQIVKLRQCASEYIGGEDSTVYDGEGYTRAEDELYAAFIMLYTHDDLSLNSKECTLENKLNERDLDIDKWGELQDNDWSWFAKNLWKYGIKDEIEHLYLLRVKHVETTDMEGYALYTTDDKATVDEATERFAQAFLGSQANLDENCYEFNSTKQYPLEAMEVNETEFRTYAKLNIKQYKSLTDIPADSKQVALMM